MLSLTLLRAAGAKQLADLVRAGELVAVSPSTASGLAYFWLRP
jgi:hypothetical protein